MIHLVRLSNTHNAIQIFLFLKLSTKKKKNRLPHDLAIFIADFKNYLLEILGDRNSIYSAVDSHPVQTYLHH